ncbi:MAG TPA: DUF5829 family protein [Gemmatimonadales bacterium]|jgi:hypothetical protein
MKGMFAALPALAVVASATSPVGGQGVPLVLHHLVVSVDSATYHEIATSPFVREEFAATQSGFLNGVDGGIGTRLIGKYNFLQFIPVTNAMLPANGVAIVLASERVGGLGIVAKQGMFEPGGQMSALPIEGPGGSSNTPPMYPNGVDRIRPAGADSTSRQVEFEVEEYRRTASESLSKTDSLPVSRLTVQRFLAPYFDSHKLLAYVSSATLAMPVDDIKHIVAVLRRDQLKVATEGEGAVIDLGGITVHLIPPWSGAGVKQIKFALTSDVPANPVYRFGARSQLRFGPGAIAVWDFGPR